MFSREEWCVCICGAALYLCTGKQAAMKLQITHEQTHTHTYTHINLCTYCFLGPVTLSCGCVMLVCVCTYVDMYACNNTILSGDSEQACSSATSTNRVIQSYNACSLTHMCERLTFYIIPAWTVCIHHTNTHTHTHTQAYTNVFNSLTLPTRGNMLHA